MDGPFDREHADAWSTDFVDLEPLNGRATEAVLGRIEDVRRSAQAGPARLRAHGVLVLGPAGSGKTHLFARLRRRAGVRATFVLMRPEIAADPTPRHVLAACVDALQRRAAGSDERQIDLVVGSAFALLAGRGAKWPNAYLDELRSGGPIDQEVYVGKALAHIEELYPEVEVGWLERLLYVPFADAVDRRAAVAWLSGREPDATQLDRLGLENPLPDTSVLPALRALAIVASYSTPIVLVFDQLENLIDDDGPPARIHAHARLVCELFDTVRGMVIVQMALDAEWARRIQPALGPSERSRLETRVETLELPTADQRHELLRSWVAELPPGELRQHPWPLSAEEASRWLTGPGVTPRMLLLACRAALLRGDAPVPEEKDVEEADLDDRMAELWEEEIALARRSLDDATQAGRGLDAERLASGLAAAFRLTESLRADRAPARSGASLRVAAREGNTDVFVVQQAHWRSAATALQRATQAARERPILAIREASIPFPPTWRKVAECLDTLQAQPRATWLELARDDVARLVALQGLLSSARSQDLTARDGRPLREDEVRGWARGALGVEEWPALASLLAAPKREAAPPGSEPPAPVPAASPAPTTVVRDVLSTLLLASLDRVVREAQARDRTLTRAAILQELRSMGASLRWLGRSIVWWGGQDR